MNSFLKLGAVEKIMDAASQDGSAIFLQILILNIYGNYYNMEERKLQVNITREQ